MTGWGWYWTAVIAVLAVIVLPALLVFLHGRWKRAQGRRPTRRRTGNGDPK